MQFPESSYSKVIKELKPGQVIRCPIIFEKEPVSKRLIILSCNNSETILALTTTSNKFAPTRHYGKDDIYIEQGLEKSFDLPTYVQLHRVIVLETCKVIKLFSNNKVDVLADVSNDLLLKIYGKVDTSELIEGKFRKRIKEEYDKFKKDSQTAAH
jgi:hypothetical protein